MCELLTRPAMVPVADLRPEFSWALHAARPGDRQTAYQVLVASRLANLKTDTGDMWDSGKVAGSSSCAVEYGGAPLDRDRIYYWKVRIWDQGDRARWWEQPRHAGRRIQSW